MIFYKNLLEDSCVPTVCWKNSLFPGGGGGDCTSDVDETTFIIHYEFIHDIFLLKCIIKKTFNLQFLLSHYYTTK